MCYLFIAALGCIAFVKRSRWPITVAFLLSVIAQANIDTISRFTNDSFEVVLMLRLLPFFLGGGMGQTTITAARIYKYGEDGSLTMDTLERTARIKTFSADAQTTDSAK